MDPFIHSAAGAFIGWALPERRVGPGAAPIVLLGALLPDVDVFIEPFVDPQSGFVHRGFTHSLFGVAILAPLAALVGSRLSKQKSFARCAALIAIGMLSHLLLDLPTPMGVELFYPFSRKPVYLDFLGYADWTLFILAFFVLFAAWTYSNRDQALRRGILSAALLASLNWWLFSAWPTLAFTLAATVEEATEEPFRTVYPLVLVAVLICLLAAFARNGWGFRQNRMVFGRLGVAALSIYLGICLTGQWIALSQTRQFTRERRIVARKQAASRMGLSSLVGPFHWTGVVLAPEGVYLARISPFNAGSPKFHLFPSASENPFIAKSRLIPRVQRFLSGARFPVVRSRLEQGQPVVEFQDYGLSWRPLLRVVLNERQEVLTVDWIEH
jgi:membrane-bound metal-dependent hydrolase YbcI (DUF457 family)